MLLFCYQWTKDWSRFHEFARQLILYLEVPLIRLLLRLSGANQVIPRHSIHQRHIFNIFMSDLDFTIVGEEKHFAFFHQVYGRLQKLFPNLGEVEFYESPEWEELLRLKGSPHFHLWEKIYLIRKLSWQRTKFHKASTSYENIKQSRAIQITLNRLNQASLPLRGDEIFSELKSYTVPYSYSFPRGSAFLENTISTEGRDGLLIQSLSLANAFVYVLPESLEVVADTELNGCKYVLVRKEYYLTKTSVRLKKIRNPDAVVSEEQKWMEDLQNLSVSLREKLG